MINNYLTEKIRNKNVIMFVSIIFFMAGILAFFNNCILPLAFIVTVILSVLLIRKSVHFKYILLWGFIFYFGFFNTSLRIHSKDALVEFVPSDAVLTGRIISIPTGGDKEKTKFFFKVSKVNDEKVNAKTLVYLQNIDEEFLNLEVGNVYKITGKLRKPFESGNPSQFDYGKYLRNFNTYTVFYADNSNCVNLHEKLSFKWQFLGNLNNLRNRIIKTHSLYLESPNLEILGGIVFGDDAVSPPDFIKDVFKNSGLLHILAASGMNVAFIYGFWYFILRRLKVPYKITVITGMGVIILYTLMTGLGASVIRAALMLLFVLAGKLIDRDAHSVALLSFVASLMLLYNPAFINDVGFQLSFIVTFGLLTTANAVIEHLHNIKFPDWLSAELLIPVVAQIWVAPIQMFYFNSFSTYSILANIAIMPFLSIISFLGFVSSVLAVIPQIANFVCMLSDFVLKYLLDILVIISTFFAKLPYALLQTTHPSVFQIVIFYLLILIITLMFKVGVTKRILSICAVLLFVLLVSIIPIKNHNLEIIAFDVQNADAFLIKTPLNKYFIIDTGKSGYNNGSSQAKIIILKYLKDKGIKNIEGLIVTHFDNDHAGGVVDLISGLKVKKIYINSLNNTTYTAKKIYSCLKSYNSETILVRNNAVIYQENDLKITTYQASTGSDNEDSIIAWLSKGDFDALFMGDAGTDAFNKIRENLDINVLDVFKVGHHGGNGVVDSRMTEILKPQISIISTGQNQFGHPNKITLDTLRKSDIYRTDINNSIKISVKNSTYDVLTFNKNEHKYKKFKTYDIN